MSKWNEFRIHCIVFLQYTIHFLYFCGSSTAEEAVSLPGQPGSRVHGSYGLSGHLKKKAFAKLSEKL